MTKLERERATTLVRDHVLAAEELKTGSSSFTHATGLTVEIVSGSLPSPVIWTITGSPKEKDSCSWPKIAQTTQGS
jgi:hypothetical protein